MHNTIKVHILNHLSMSGGVWIFFSGVQEAPKKDLLTTSVCEASEKDTK